MQAQLYCEDCTGREMHLSSRMLSARSLAQAGFATIASSSAAIAWAAGPCVRTASRPADSLKPLTALVSRLSLR